MVRVAHDAGKKLRVSIAGFNPAEYATVLEAAFAHGVDEVEHNLGCPNVWSGSEQKPIVSFVPSLVEEIVLAVGDTGLPGIAQLKQSFKLSPYSDPQLLAEIARIMCGKGWVGAVVTSNTFPNALAFDENGVPDISVGEGLAGLGGSALKHIALGQVRQFRSWLDEFTDVVGVGGICTGGDLLDFLHAGAGAIQIGTAFIERGPRVFSEILTQYADLVEPAGESA